MAKRTHLEVRLNEVDRERESLTIKNQFLSNEIKESTRENDTLKSDIEETKDFFHKECINQRKQYESLFREIKEETNVKINELYKENH